jgi:hypothetical protein
VKTRPVEALSPSYRIEDAIQAILLRRGITAPAPLTGGQRQRVK